MDSPLRPTADQYTVAWLCALPESELLAAVNSLDIEHTAPILKAADANNYQYGSINGHNIVMACMPPGDPGLVSANSLIQPLRYNFRNLRIHLFVGIGGGVPHDPPCSDPKNDIHLGDVVVGWGKETGDPAVVQYDYGKLRETHFQPTGYLDRTERSLVIALGTVLMKQRRGRTQFQDHLAHIKAQNPDFAHPGLNNDKLRSADCIHGIVKDCSGCLDLVDRPSRNNENLVFHQSTIASGNTVIKNARERDRLSKLCNNARCLEMEAAGVMNEIRPLIIRGIADYADGHKNSRWHDYAAAAAAAFAKELLYTIAPTTVEVLQPVSENGVSQMEILDSLKRYTYNPRFENVMEPYEQTYHWIWAPKTQEGPGFVEWLQESNGRNQVENYVFWIRGKPGAGKSTLMRYMCKTFRNQTPTESKQYTEVKSSKYFFSRLGTNSEHTINGFLLALLAQLCITYQELVPLIAAIFGQQKESFLRNREDVWNNDLAIEALNIISTQTIVTGFLVLYVDGVDECEGDLDFLLTQLLRFIRRINHGPLKIKACIASRDHPDIRKSLYKSKGFAIHDWTARDIQKYVSGVLQGEVVETLHYSELETLNDAVLRKAEGVFIWVKIVVNELSLHLERGGGYREVFQTLSRLPGDITDLYEAILTEIAEKGYLTEAALWVEVIRIHTELPTRSSSGLSLNTGHVHDQWVEIDLLDIYFVMDDARKAFTSNPKPMSKDLKIISARLAQKRLRERCRDLVQVQGSIASRWQRDSRVDDEPNGIDELPIYQRHCTLVHGTFTEYILSESWQNWLKRLGDKATMEKVWERIMIVWLRRLQNEVNNSFWPINWSDEANDNDIRSSPLYWLMVDLFNVGAYYERSTNRSIGPYLKTLDSYLNKTDTRWCGRYLQGLFVDVSSWNPYRGRFAPILTHADLVSIGVIHSLHLFVQEELEEVSIINFHKLLPFLTIIFHDVRTVSREMLTYLLDVGFSINASLNLVPMNTRAEESWDEVLGVNWQSSEMEMNFHVVLPPCGSQEPQCLDECFFAHSYSIVSAESKWFELCALLLNHGLYIGNIASTFNAPLLHNILRCMGHHRHSTWFSLEESRTLLRDLLKAGANTEVRDEHGRTAYESIAAPFSSKESSMLLKGIIEAHDEKLEIRDEHGRMVNANVASRLRAQKLYEDVISELDSSDSDWKEKARQEDLKRCQSAEEENERWREIMRDGTFGEPLSDPKITNRIAELRAARLRLNAKRKYSSTGIENEGLGDSARRSCLTLDADT